MGVRARSAVACVMVAYGRRCRLVHFSLHSGGVLLVYLLVQTHFLRVMRVLAEIVKNKIVVSENDLVGVYLMGTVGPWNLLFA